MHPLHDYVAKQLAEKLKARKVVIWYDARSEFAPFIAEVRGGARQNCEATPVTIAASSARLAEYDGSLFELRAVVEPHVSGDNPENLVVYLPRCERDRRGSVLMELEKAGECYEPQLKRLARNVLRQRYTDGVIDEMLARERVTYQDLARASSDTSSDEPPSIIKSIFHEISGSDTLFLLAAWISRDTNDVEIESKEATGELVKLVLSKLGLQLAEDVPITKLRALTLRYVLAGEFRSSLTCVPPTALDAVPAPRTKDEEAVVKELARRLRTRFSDVYVGMADRVEAELGLREAKIPPDALGSIDTFRFEERAVLSHCGDLVAARQFDKALGIIAEQEHSFWVDHDVARKAQWEACRRMAELGSACVTVRGEVTKTHGDAKSWIDAYTSSAGWFRVDQAQRRLEAWVANLDDDPKERPLAVVRGDYEEVCRAMADGFTKAMVRANWNVHASLHQTDIYSEVVAERPKPVAYFLVDAMRFEMGVELAERLPKTTEVTVRPAIASLPSITPIGMAALQPGASSSFSVVEQKGTLGARIDGVFLPDLTARKKFTAARLPNLSDIPLDELLSLQPSKLAKRVDGSQVIIVRSQEIDHAGEAGFTFQARQVMDTVIDNLARAIRKLAGAGVEQAVITADHGHLFFPSDRDESMRINSPGGNQVDIHRRCWIGRGGATPPSCVRVSAAALGYESDLDFVFPLGSGVFKAGGDLAFHHGGPSLQELVIPVLTVRLKTRGRERATGGPVSATGLPDAVTNRIFSVTIQVDGKNLSLFSAELVVRPLLISAGKQVGGVGMAIDADLDRATGCIKLQPGKPVTVAFLLSDESVASLRVVVQDPTTDAELYRSPTDIPVRLGV